MSDIVIGVGTGNYNPFDNGDMRYATAGVEVELALDEAGIKTSVIRQEEDDPGCDGLKMDLRTGLISAIFIANIYHDDGGEKILLPNDGHIKRIARVAAREVVPIFTQAPQSAVNLALEGLSAEIVTVGEDFEIIKQTLGAVAYGHSNQ